MKVITAIIVGIAFVAGIWIASSAYKSRAKATETVTVTGSAEKDFVSDLIVWTGSYSRKSMDLKTAYAQLKTDETTIRAYLKGKGVAENQMVFSAVEINKDFSYETDQNGRSVQRFTGYNLIQNVRVESGEVDKILGISRQATELIEGGIEFTSQSPLFYYTRLTDIKMDLLAQASADGKQRAEIIAKNAGSSLGKLKKATLGVFQITGKNSDEDYSYGGTFNTSSLNKTGSITIRMEFTVK
ncbi:MAG: SIMPL domain-containing protein [Chitinophagaceae bacterium]|nr:SIMPL domain-containing protein [Chitinophagaceae bacterium]MCW5914135.1 SIMPL domain-containing protein [Chitinophagaceae bacterium]MCZ2395058.1 SIMPL domain-containing protein [Chitinophagales bacterium]